MGQTRSLLATRRMLYELSQGFCRPDRQEEEITAISESISISVTAGEAAPGREYHSPRPAPIWSVRNRERLDHMRLEERVDRLEPTWTKSRTAQLAPDLATLKVDKFEPSPLKIVLDSEECN